MSDTSKTAKIIKRWYYSTAHWQLGDVMVSDITFLWFLLFSICHSLHVAVNKCINWCFVHLYTVYIGYTRALPRAPYMHLSCRLSICSTVSCVRLLLPIAVAIAYATFARIAQCTCASACTLFALHSLQRIVLSGRTKRRHETRSRCLFVDSGVAKKVQGARPPMPRQTHIQTALNVPIW